MKKIKCRHFCKQGPEVERLYGTFKTELCINCKKFRLLDHNNIIMSEWINGAKFINYFVQNDE